VKPRTAMIMGIVILMTAFLVETKRLVPKPSHPVRANREALASHLY
jgi:hypothetical protein